MSETMSLSSLNKPPKFFISAGEASSDAHAAGVIREIRAIHPEASFHGLGGPQMAEAGCNLLENMVDKSAMLHHVLGKLGWYRAIHRKTVDWLDAEKPDALITVDSFDGNMFLIWAAHKRRIPVLIFVAPQLWAWFPARSWLIRKAGARVASILPFEQEWYSKRGISVEFVGHPLFDDYVPPESPSESYSTTLPKDVKQHIDPTPTVALLPGSRMHELEYHWPVLQQIAWRIRQRYAEARFLTSALSEQQSQWLKENGDPMLGIEISCKSLEEVVGQSQLAVLSSGTATLQVAKQGCPMVVIYHIPSILWALLGRTLITTPYLCIVNILAQRELVPEFMPVGGRLAEAADKAIGLLESTSRCDKMRSELLALCETLCRPNPAGQVAQMATDMIKTENGSNG